MAIAFKFGMKHHLVAFYQTTLNYGLDVENGPMLWVLGFYIEIKQEIFKNLRVQNHKG